MEEKDIKSEARQKDRRVVRAINTEIGRGSPNFLNLEGNARRVGDAGKPSRSTKLYLDMVEHCIENPGEWFHRKMYYDQAPHSSPFSTAASVFTQTNTRGTYKTNGDVKHNDSGSNSPYPGLPERVGDVCRTYGGEFEVSYTREIATSDQPQKGKYMHVLFLRFVRTRTPDPLQLMAVSSDD